MPKWEHSDDYYLSLKIEPVISTKEIPVLEKKKKRRVRFHPLKVEKNKSGVCPVLNNMA